MLRNGTRLEGYELQARDGAIGHVRDLYFDDHHWSLRYFVVDAGSWLVSRQVLISPLAVHSPQWNEKRLPVDLSKEQIKNSPGIDTDRPVSRQHEMSLSDYYGWPYYWADPTFAGIGMTTPIPVAAADGTQAAAQAAVEDDAGDPHLRSLNHVRGHHIVARDGEIGHVDDLLLDDATWQVRYLVIDTRNWWPGKKVLISPLWITGFGWSDAKVYVDLSRQAVQGSPEYDPQRPVDTGYAARLHDYYGRPRPDERE